MIIDICGQVWRREKLERHGISDDVPLSEGAAGSGKPLTIMDHPVRDRIPIEIWGASWRAGLAKRSADLPPHEIVAGGLLAIGDDVDELRELARQMLTVYFGGMEAKGRNYYS